MVCAARALGSLGADAPLRKALVYRPGAEAEETDYDYELTARVAALAGTAYLPGDMKPLSRLREYSRMFPDHQMRKACEKAMVEAFRLSAQR